LTLIISFFRNVSKNQKYIFLKENEECDGIFENISFVEMKSSKLILIILKTAFRALGRI
jgi:hypothetical protein